ncbi:MAG TPA: TIR domain-containing protein [Mycobacteriales bacterium]|nr:TIR domain-containing protein [Mycobacteriales bacterium]
MGGVFINYRKGPHTGQVEALHDRLVEHFGAGQVFLDLSMRAGARYPDELRARVAGCDVFLAIIHPGWLTDADADGTPRITLKGDWVRKEIAQALQQGKTVIPVLLAEATLPRRDELPRSIQEMPMRQRMRIAQGSWRTDLNRLITEIEQHVSPWTPPSPATPDRPPERWPRVALIAVAASLAAGLAWVPSATAAPLAVWSLLVMLAWLVANAVPALARRTVYSVERATHPVPAGRYNSRLAYPLGLAWLGLCDAAIVTSGGSWLWAAFVTFVGVGYLAGLALRAEADEDATEANWPQLPGDCSPLALRRAVARLARRLTGWQAPLSRQQRDQAAWVLQNLGAASDRLRADAGRDRPTWLRADHPRAAAAHLLWVAGTGALALAAAHGLRGYLTAAALVSMAILSTAGLGEMTYRVERWRRHTLATEIDNRLSELRQLVHNQH